MTLGLEAAPKNYDVNDALSKLWTEDSIDVEKVKRVATNIADPYGHGIRDHWAKEAHCLLIAIIIHVAYTARFLLERDATVEDIRNFLPPQSRSLAVEEVMSESKLNEVLRNMRDGVHKVGEDCLHRYHHICSDVAVRLLDSPDRERVGVACVVRPFLRHFDEYMAAGVDQSQDASDESEVGSDVSALWQTFHKASADAAAALVACGKVDADPSIPLALTKMAKDAAALGLSDIAVRELGVFRLAQLAKASTFF